MDLVAEYAHAYGGAPRPEQSWHEVVSLVSRATRFDMRARLVVADGTILGQPVADSDRGKQMMWHEKLRRQAYGDD